jgi:hypothetical protein
MEQAFSQMTLTVPRAPAKLWASRILHAFAILFLIHCLSWPARAQTAWQVETVDGGRGTPVGYSPSLAIDQFGNLHLGYMDTSRNVLRYAYRGKHEDHWDKMDLDSSVGYSTTLALDPQGKPHFAYQGFYEKGLHYAAWDGSAWHKQLIDPLSVAFFMSMQIDKQGHPKISYYKRMNPDMSFALQLKYAFFDGSSWYRETVDPREGTGKFNTLALDPDGNPHIVYSNIVSFDLEYAHWDGTLWVHATPDTRSVSGGILGASGIALNASGEPCFAYVEYAHHILKFAYKSGNSYQSEVIQQFGHKTDQIDRISMKYDHQNRLHIAYVDYARNEVKYGLRDEHGWTLEVVESGTDLVALPSLALDENDFPQIAYFDETAGSVKIAHQQVPVASKATALANKAAVNNKAAVATKAQPRP